MTPETYAAMSELAVLLRFAAILCGVVTATCFLILAGVAVYLVRVELRRLFSIPVERERIAALAEARLKRPDEPLDKIVWPRGKAAPDDIETAAVR